MFSFVDVTVIIYYLENNLNPESNMIIRYNLRLLSINIPNQGFLGL